MDAGGLVFHAGCTEGAHTPGDRPPNQDRLGAERERFDDVAGFGDAAVREQAARVCELAKQRPCHLLATEATVRDGGPASEGWRPAGAVELRGFAQETTIYEG